MLQAIGNEKHNGKLHNADTAIFNVRRPNLFSDPNAALGIVRTSCSLVFLLLLMNTVRLMVNAQKRQYQRSVKYLC